MVGVGRFVARARGTVVLGPSPRADSLAAYAEVEVWRYGRDFSARTLEVKGGETRLELRGPGGVRVPVFQPYGPYLSRWGRRYARALGLADRVVLAPPVLSPDYASEAPYDEDWSDACPVTPLQAPDQREAAEAAMGLSGPGDVVAFFAPVSQSQVMARHAVSAGTVS